MIWPIDVWLSVWLEDGILFAYIVFLFFTVILQKKKKKKAATSNLMVKATIVLCSWVCMLWIQEGLS